MWEGQLRAFRLQMIVAKDMNRCVSTHCVGAYGLMFELLRKYSKENILPSKIALHSYGLYLNNVKSYCLFILFLKGGTSEMAKGFLGKNVKSKIYFGFAVAINMRSPKTKDVIKSIPIDRILPETDLDSPDGMEDDIKEIYKIISEVHNLTLEETARILNENAKHFYGM